MIWQRISTRCTAVREVHSSRLKVCISLVVLFLFVWIPTVCGGLPFQLDANDLMVVPGMPKELNALMRQGDMHALHNEWEAALSDYERLRSACEELKDPYLMGEAYKRMGSIYYRSGQFNLSDQITRKALLCFQGAHFDDKTEWFSRAGVARCLSSLGNIDYALGRFNQAMDHYYRAVELPVTQGRPRVAADCYTNLGGIYMRLGQYNKSRECYSRALYMSENLILPREINKLVQILDALAHTSLAQGQYKDAEAYNARCLKIARESDWWEGLAISDVTGGDIARAHGDYSGALKAHLRARSLYDKLELGSDFRNDHEMARCNMAVGRDLTNLHRYNEAREYYQRALHTFDKYRDRDDAAAALTALGLLEEVSKQPDLAIKYYKRAIPLYEEASQEVGDPAELGRFQQARLTVDPYIRYAALLALKQEHPQPKEALVILEQGRAQGLARQMQLNRVSYTEILSAADSNQFTAAEYEMTAASIHHRLLTEQRVRDRKEQETLKKRIGEAAEHLNKARQHYALLLDRLLAAYPEFRLRRQVPHYTAGQFQAMAVRNSSTLYVELAPIDNKTTLALVLSKSVVTAVKLEVGAAELRTQVEQWRTAILSDKLAVADKEPLLASRLYKQLLQPLASRRLLTPKQQPYLVCVMHGSLLNLPVPALRDSNGKRLAERFVVSSAISLGTLLRPTTSPKSTLPLLCIADPVGKDGATYRSRTRGSFAALPGARIEGKIITNLFPNSLALVGSHAHEKTVKARMQDARVLHFATHGVLDDNYALAAGLVMAPETAGSTQDGMLEAREIAGMRLAARLAVLSACETGLGKVQGSDGLIGLGWAFRAADCPTIIGSLWKVDDAATQSLMDWFYRSLKKKQRPDVALQTAMKKLWSVKPEWRNPRYWAAFQVLGETHPLF